MRRDVVDTIEIDKAIREDLMAAPEKDRTREESLRATVLRNRGAIYAYLDKGYTYAEIVERWARAKPPVRIKRDTLRTYMAEEPRDLKRYPKPARAGRRKKRLAGSTNGEMEKETQKSIANAVREKEIAPESVAKPFGAAGRKF